MANWKLTIRRFTWLWNFCKLFKYFHKSICIIFLHINVLFWKTNINWCSKSAKVSLLEFQVKPIYFFFQFHMKPTNHEQSIWWSPLCSVFSKQTNCNKLLMIIISSYQIVRFASDIFRVIGNWNILVPHYSTRKIKSSCYKWSSF